MSGVIDEKGVQWEHCTACGQLVPLSDLGYELPRHGYPYGRDLCIDCVDAGIRSGDILFEAISPAKSWVVTQE